MQTGSSGGTRGSAFFFSILSFFPLGHSLVVAGFFLQHISFEIFHVLRVTVRAWGSGRGYFLLSQLVGWLVDGDHAHTDDALFSPCA